MPITDTDDRTRSTRRARQGAILAEVAQEEAEAAEAEVVEKASLLDVPLHLRIHRGLDTELRRPADAAQVLTSALVRRLLCQAVSEHSPLTTAEAEDNARRVARQEVQGG